METIELLKAALAKGVPEDALLKAWTQSSSATSGLTAYDLEAPAKSLFPVITPLRNALPRVGGGKGIQANWRAITGINTANVSAGVSEGNRGGVTTTSTADYLAAYKGIGLEDYVTFEADYAAMGFDDVRARAVTNLLSSLMLQEERIILGGNSTLALGTTPTPTATDSSTGGALGSAQTLSVIAVALTLEGYMNSTVAAGVSASISRTNADASTDTYGGGAAQKSAAGAVTLSGGASLHSIQASLTAVRGAFAYAWYAGTSGAETLNKITTINSAVITAMNSAGQAASVLPSSDKSSNTLVFDGFLTQIAKTSGNAYFATQSTGTVGTGTPLTADAAGGISEFDTALQSFWDNYRLSPSEIWVSSQEMNYIRKKVLTGSSNASQRFIFQAAQAGFMGGTMIRGYTNPFTMAGAAELPIKLHPNLPPGTVMFMTDKLPYPLSNVTNINQIRTRREYYQLEWPLKSRKYEYGVYADEVLQCYFPPSLGMITNIGAG